MSKNKKEDTVEASVVVTTPSTLTDTAYGIAKNPKTGWYHVITFQYNLDGSVGPITRLGEGDERSIAIERFKIKVAEELL